MVPVRVPVWMALVPRTLETASTRPLAPALVLLLPLLMAPPTAAPTSLVTPAPAVFPPSTTLSSPSPAW